MGEGDFSHSHADGASQNRASSGSRNKSDYLNTIVFSCFRCFRFASWLYMKRRGGRQRKDKILRSSHLFSGVVPTGFLKPKRWCFSGHIFLI